ncbi:MAG TPA: TIGR04282 family arsenosugar biosynthesis glycosyltransferase [Candidatus Binataceae bacterium]|nr:TIGR04282 family arsenosugar biosynthesis glycosyltransferase [Candidatus Binataceae bacterium]
MSPRPSNSVVQFQPARRRAKRDAPALIVFAREPIPGRTKTRLIPLLGARGAARLADAFIVDALAKAARIEGSRLVIAAAAEGRAHTSKYFAALARRFGAELVDQGKGDLGRRMARVLEPYADPPGGVLFGVDTPSLPASLIRESMRDLRHAPVVLGPAIDGGYYLLGVRGSLPDIFRAIAWGSAQVMDQTLRRLRHRRVRYRLGRWWYDIDRAADLEFLAADLTCNFVAHRVSACPATAALISELKIVELVQGR